MQRPELDALSLALDRDPEAFRAFADALPHMVFVADGAGRVLYYNERWHQFNGVRGREPQSPFGLQGFVHPDDAPAARTAWNRALETKQPVEMEYRLLERRAQTYRWFLGRAVPVQLGEVVRLWVCTSTDIDSQKRANENLNLVIDSAGAFGAARTARAVANEFASFAVTEFADCCLVLLRDRRGQFDLAAAAYREEAKYAPDSFAHTFPVRPQDDLAALLEAREPRLYRHASSAALPLPLGGMSSAMFAPLAYQDELLGGVMVYNAEPQRSFGQGDFGVFRLLAERASMSIAQVQAITQEQRIKRRLQFIGRATEAIFESLDVGATFSRLTDLIVESIADVAAVVRVRGGTARIIAASAGDTEKEPFARAFAGVRAFNPQFEERFIRDLNRHRTLVSHAVETGRVAQTAWPYLAADVMQLGMTSVVTVPLHARGNTSGAILAYRTNAGKPFGKDDVEVLTEIGKHASIAMENAEVFERERRIAETLQDSLLPPSLPAFEDLRFNAVYLPAAAEANVGGDWYDAFTREDGSVVLSVGDVTGQGPYAAVIMGKIRHLIAIAPSYERDPARILDEVEAVLARRYPEAIATAILGFIQPDRKAMRVANAGHPRPILRRHGSVTEIECEGLPIGVRRRMDPSESCTVDLTDANMLVFYTDGLTEATHNVIEGTDHLLKVARSDAIRHVHDPARFIETACLPNGADDDVAVMTISFGSAVRWGFDAENAKAAQDARSEFVAYVLSRGADPDDAAMAELAFGELVGNVVRHTPGPIDIDVEWADGSVRLHVIDRGPAFSIDRPSQADLLSESGRGLFIVRTLARSLNVEHIPGYGNHVTVELPVALARAATHP